eukprot:326676_1
MGNCSGQNKEKLSIVFLDVDGVLNCTETNGNIDDDKLIFLKEIIDATKANIVISSSWRNTTKKLNAVANALDKHGMEYIDTTPKLEHYRRNYRTPEKNRVSAIVTYLQNARETYRIDKWVAIDDYNLIKFSAGKTFEGHFVHTSTFHGIRKKDVDQAIQLLL